MSAEPTPRYSWRRTWPDIENDFTGFDGDRRFGRIHQHHMGNWLWFLTMQQDFHDRALMGATTGAAATARQAAATVESCYDRVMAGEWPGMTERDAEVARRLRESGAAFVDLRSKSGM